MSDNAATLNTRRAAQLMSQVLDLRAEPGGEALDDARAAVVLKAMLVHGASWGDLEGVFDRVFDGSDNGPKRWWRIKRACTQFLGYGPVDFERGTVCTDQRVILVGCAELNADQAHVYNVSLPTALHAQTVMRRLTITLAWLSPVNPRHRSYRGADLWFDPPGNDEFLRTRRVDADHDAVKRGTVQHEILEGSESVLIRDGDILPVQVNCRPDGLTKLAGPVPYALMVSLEVAEPLGVSVYEQVRVALDRVRAAPRVRPTARPASRTP